MDENFKLDIKKRPRRLRKSNSILDLCQETRVLPSDLILPIFIKEGKSGADPIAAMPFVMRHTIDSLLRTCEGALKRGVRAIAPFPMVETSFKSLCAQEAANPNSLVNRAISAVKKNFPEITIFADIALDPYTSHGHDGILDKNNYILNDETVEVLCAMSLVAAQAGADFLAPSDMMDGRIGAIRNVLDDCDFINTGIMAYSAKYASSLYGPFRDAIGSSPKAPVKQTQIIQKNQRVENKKVPRRDDKNAQHPARAERNPRQAHTENAAENIPTGANAATAKSVYLDKRSYQLNPANSREAVREALLDQDEGADIVMVKPAGMYLDIISKVKDAVSLPVAAYQVSGEYAMIMAAAQHGWIDLERAKIESVTAIKRAGADMILTYFA